MHAAAILSRGPVLVQDLRCTGEGDHDVVRLYWQSALLCRPAVAIQPFRPHEQRLVGSHFREGCAYKYCTYLHSFLLSMLVDVPFRGSGITQLGFWWCDTKV